MLRISIGTKLEHKTLGPCRVTAIARGGKYFFVSFSSGAPSGQFASASAEQYFSPPDALLDKFGLRKAAPADVRPLLEAVDRGDTTKGLELVTALDRLKEFSAVDRICRRLKSLGLELDYFLLLKQAKALRRLVGRAEDAVTVASDALTHADNKKRQSIARTVRAAAWVDLGKLDDAEGDCRKALEESPDSPHPYRVMGKVFVLRSNYEKADKCFEAGAVRDPEGRNDILVVYKDRVERLCKEGKAGEIEQIREHIGKRWPPELAARAFKEIEAVLSHGYYSHSNE
ncbi:MAG: hypothetical protein SF051_10850 [Elusimicrobiota bacterium]|nr:hypothetical protein [Elusimicrobiota bacterium]